MSSFAVIKNSRNIYWIDFNNFYLRCIHICIRSRPQMAEEISKPLSAANKVTMVSSGGSEVGAAKLAGEVLDIMTRLPSAVEKLTGIDISQVSCRM